MRKLLIAAVVMMIFLAGCIPPHIKSRVKDNAAEARFIYEKIAPIISESSKKDVIKDSYIDYLQRHLEKAEKLDREVEGLTDDN